MGKVGVVVIALIIGIVVVSMQYSKKSDLADDTRLQVTAFLESLPDYSEAGPYYESLADTHHEAIFAEYHKTGGRRTRSSFDSMGYIKELLEEMAKDAENNNQTARAGYLRELKGGVFLEIDSG